VTTGDKTTFRERNRDASAVGGGQAAEPVSRSCARAVVIGARLADPDRRVNDAANETDGFIGCYLFATVADTPHYGEKPRRDPGLD
jgi:hypothetical protein